MQDAPEHVSGETGPGLPEDPWTPISFPAGPRGGLERLGAEVAERAVGPRSLVPDLEPLEDRQPRFLVRADPVGQREVRDAEPCGRPAGRHALRDHHRDGGLSELRCVRTQSRHQTLSFWQAQSCRKGCPRFVRRSRHARRTTRARSCEQSQREAATSHRTRSNNAPHAKRRTHAASARATTTGPSPSVKRWFVSRTGQHVTSTRCEMGSRSSSSTVTRRHSIRDARAMREHSPSQERPSATPRNVGTCESARRIHASTASRATPPGVRPRSRRSYKGRRMRAVDRDQRRRASPRSTRSTRARMPARSIPAAMRASTKSGSRRMRPAHREPMRRAPRTAMTAPAQSPPTTTCSTR